MAKINWDTIGLFEEGCISLKFSLFMNTVLYNYQKCFLIKTIKLKYTNRNPWITEELKKRYQNQRPLIHNKKKDLISDLKYKQYKNLNISKQRQVESDYYREYLEIHQHDLKKCNKNIIGKEDNQTIKNINYL